MTSYRQPEGQQEVVGNPEATADRVDLVYEVLEADDAMFTWEKDIDNLNEFFRSEILTTLNNDVAVLIIIVSGGRRLTHVLLDEGVVS